MLATRILLLNKLIQPLFVARSTVSYSFFSISGYLLIFYLCSAKNTSSGPDVITTPNFGKKGARRGEYVLGRHDICSIYFSYHWQYSYP